MAAAASFADALLGLELGATGQDAGNHFSVEGLSAEPRQDGGFDIAIGKAEAAALRLAAGPLVLEIERITLHQLTAEAKVGAGVPRLVALQAAEAQLAGLKAEGPLLLPQPAALASAAPAGSWRLGPLAAANGTLRAEIVDAHLGFDADVAVPVQQGGIDFNRATVEHVGPDSRMGVSRMGVYVDAPNGRSYLVQFASPPVTGVAYERRGALLGPRVSDRGSLRLQEFGEALLAQGQGGKGPGFTDQARLLLDRAAVSGELRLGDGAFAAPGVQVETAGRAQGHNTVRVHSGAVGRGITAEIASVMAANAVLGFAGRQLACDQITGALTLRVAVQAGQLQFAFACANLQLRSLRLQAARSSG